MTYIFNETPCKNWFYTCKIENTEANPLILIDKNNQKMFSIPVNYIIKIPVSHAKQDSVILTRLSKIARGKRSLITANA